jgi:type II secretory pathway predicted ATPase ExeA
MLRLHQAAISLTSKTRIGPSLRPAMYLASRRHFSSELNPRSVYEDSKGLIRNYFDVKLAAGIAVLAAGVWYYFSEDNVSRITRAFEAGELVYNKIADEHKIHRPEVVAEIKSLFLQPSETHAYFLIVGETGTGKTTAILDAVSDLKVPRGVVYFMAPAFSDHFVSNLARKLNYDPNALDFFATLKKRITGRTEEVPKVDLSILLQHLEQAAQAFKAKHGRQPVLIIDAADFIAKRRPDLMQTLQDFAKTEADAKRLRVIFASSEGSVLPLMTASASIKRASIIEIGDISDEQALKYLQSFQVPDDRAIDAVANITGGRLIDLVQYKSAYSKYKSNADYRKPFDEDIKSALVRLQFQKDHDLFEALKSGPVGTSAALSYVTAEQLAYLLKHNVLAQHADRSLSFHSRVVKTFFGN